MLEIEKHRPQPYRLPTKEGESFDAREMAERQVKALEKHISKKGGEGPVFSSARYLQSHTTFQIEVENSRRLQIIAPNILHDSSIAILCTFIASPESALTVSLVKTTFTCLCS